MVVTAHQFTDTPSSRSAAFTHCELCVATLAHRSGPLRGHYVHRCSGASLVDFAKRVRNGLPAVKSDPLEWGDYPVKPGGRAFYNSYVGMLIEAHLLYAHNDQHEYVARYINRVAELGDHSKDPKHERMKTVARIYDNIRSAYINRGRLNLSIIDERINLVATNLKEG